MNITNHEHKKPIYAVELKAPHKLTVSQLVAGLHEIDLERDIIDKENETFEFHATRLVAAVVTQIFSFMHDSGVQYGCIHTGEAFVFLHIPEDPTIVEYHLCIPGREVKEANESNLHQTAVGRLLGFTLEALNAEAPSQEWRSTAREQLSTWKVEYFDILRNIPETCRKEPPTSNYRPSHWKPSRKKHNTRSRARCNPDVSTPEGSPSENSHSDEQEASPSLAAAARKFNRAKDEQQSARGQKRKQPDRSAKHTQNKTQNSYCTMACLRGMANRGLIDRKCPNWQQHGGNGYRHEMDSRDFTRRLDHQLLQNRDEGFEPLNILGRTGYLMRATLLSHGYSVIIKATTKHKKHVLKAEADNYHRLRALQGNQIPVYLGDFEPRIDYWYQGSIMAHMMILSWSGIRVQRITNKENSHFFHQEREKTLRIFGEQGAEHGDPEWRNMLWNEQTHSLVVVDLEEVDWVK